MYRFLRALWLQEKKLSNYYTWSIIVDRAHQTNYSILAKCNIKQNQTTNKNVNDVFPPEFVFLRKDYFLER